MTKQGQHITGVFAKGHVCAPEILLCTQQGISWVGGWESSLVDMLRSPQTTCSLRHRRRTRARPA